MDMMHYIIIGVIIGVGLRTIGLMTIVSKFTDLLLPEPWTVLGWFGWSKNKPPADIEIHQILTPPTKISGKHMHTLIKPLKSWNWKEGRYSGRDIPAGFGSDGASSPSNAEFGSIAAWWHDFRFKWGGYFDDIVSWFLSNLFFACDMRYFDKAGLLRVYLWTIGLMMFSWVFWAQEDRKLRRGIWKRSMSTRWQRIKNKFK